MSNLMQRHDADHLSWVMDVYSEKNGDDAFGTVVLAPLVILYVLNKLFAGIRDEEGER